MFPPPLGRFNFSIWGGGRVQNQPQCTTRTPSERSIQTIVGSVNCCVDEACFEVPSGYRLSNALDPRSGVYGGSAGLQGRLYDEEDAMLQYAIQQSLRESGQG